MAKKQTRPSDMGDAFVDFSSNYPSRSHDTVFFDLLNSMLYFASAGELHKAEFEAAKKQYGEANLMSFIDHIAERSTGFRDALGEIYEHISSSSHNSALGQFFTPEVVARFMAEIIIHEPSDAPQSIGDPSGCGSGRMLLAAARAFGNDLWRHQFTGIDIDGVCVKITTVNCWLNSMPAFIIHGNGLSYEVWDAYEVILNWHEGEAGGGWLPFVVKQPKELCEQLTKMQKADMLGKALNTANKGRVENLKKHKAAREKPKNELVELLKAVADIEAPPSPEIVDFSDEKPEADKVIAPIDTAPIQPIASGRRGKPTPPNQAALF